jgi:TolB-like protein
VAVLPFKTIRLSASADTTDEHFFGVGLADSLIARLGRIHKFLVMPTSSIVGFVDSATDPIKTGRLLGVDYLLDGNIKLTKDKLRLSVQLLDVKGNAAVWATSIDEKAGEIFALEEALSSQLIEVLVPRLSSADLANYSRRGTESPEAFENYLRGRYHFSSMTEEGLAKSFLLFHQAIAADPNYAHAYCGVANYYNWLGVIGVLPPSECFPPALAAARTAVELDENISEAHASLGFAVHVGEFEWLNAERHFQRAVELNRNNANAHLWYSTFLFMAGRFEKGFEYAEKAVTLDPLAPYSHYNVGSGLYYARRFEEAEAQHQKVVDEFPDYGLGLYGLSKVHRYLGKTELANEENERAFKLLDGSTIVQISRAECLAALGDFDAARKKLDELKELESKRFVSPYMLALARTFLGDMDAVLDELERSLEAREAWLCCAPVEARFERIFTHPRFQRILEAVNHPLRSAKGVATGAEASQTRGFSDLTTMMIDADG